MFGYTFKARMSSLLGQKLLFIINMLDRHHAVHFILLTLHAVKEVVEFKNPSPVTVTFT